MPGRLLPGDRLGDEAVDLALVLGAIDLAAVQPHAQLAHLAGLGQRPGAGGREERQVEVGLRRPALVAADARAGSRRSPATRPRGGRSLVGGSPPRDRGRPARPASRPSRARTRSRAAGPRPRPCTGRNMRLVDGTSRTRLAVVGEPLDSIAHAAEVVAPHAAPVHDGDRRAPAARPTPRGATAPRPRRAGPGPRARDARGRSTVSARGPAELDGDERRLGKAEVRRVGVGGVEQPAVVVGHGQAEAGLVDLEAEARIALALPRARRPTARGRRPPRARRARRRRPACSA